MFVVSFRLARHIKRSIWAHVLAHLAQMLKVAVIDPDNPGIPDGTRQWSLEQRRMGYLNQ